MQPYSLRNFSGGEQGVKIVVHPPQPVKVKVNPATMGIGLGTPIARDYVERDPYTGDYTVTPSAEEQVLHTQHLRMTDDIVVEAIPQNYGLITWNGSVITVS